MFALFNDALEQEFNLNMKIKYFKRVVVLFLVFGLSLGLISYLSDSLSSDANIKYFLENSRSSQQLFQIPKEALEIDEETHNVFYNGYIYALTEANLDERDQLEIARSIIGEVIGYENGELGILQIKISKTSYDKGLIYCDKLEKDSRVLYAAWEIPITLQSVSESDNNPWANENIKSSNRNNPIPDGNDWWAEAVNAYPTWEFLDSYNNLSTVKVGIIDTGVENHPDLPKINYFNGFSTHISNDHGTNVAGIIGMTNNKIGGRGIASNCVELYNIDMTNYDFTSGFILMLDQMISNNCKVINCSFGVYFYDDKHYKEAIKDNIEFKGIKSYSEYEDRYKQLINTQSERCYIFLACLLKKSNKQFLIIQGAGNGLNNSGPGCNALYSGIFAYKPTEAFFDNVNKRFKISRLELENHIIIVSAFENISNKKGIYNLCDYANFGLSVDITAPGVNIFTTQLNNDYLIDGRGTSLATPIISGAAAVLWSIDPTLSSQNVKELLLFGTKRLAYNKNSPSELSPYYPALDLWSSVSKLLKMKGIENPRSISEGIYEEELNNYIISLDSTNFPEIRISIIPKDINEKEKQVVFTYNESQTDYNIKVSNNENIHLRFMKIAKEEMNVFFENVNGDLKIFDNTEYKLQKKNSLKKEQSFMNFTNGIYQLNFDIDVYSSPSIDSLKKDKIFQGNILQVLDIVQSNDGFIWGKIWDDCWVCLSDQSNHYGTIIDPNTITLEQLTSLIGNHYTYLLSPDGTYTVTDINVDGSQATCILRYSMSEKLAQELINKGGFPSTNRLIGTISIDLNEGTIKDDQNFDIWNYKKS